MPGAMLHAGEHLSMLEELKFRGGRGGVYQRRVLPAAREMFSLPGELWVARGDISFKSPGIPPLLAHNFPLRWAATWYHGKKVGYRGNPWSVPS